MKVLFITNYPAPYRVAFWNLLGKQVDLTVAFTSAPENQHHRSAEWFDLDYSGFRAVFLKKKKRLFGFTFYQDIFQELKSKQDIIVLGGYSNGTQMAAIEYLRIHRIPFLLEADGGIVQDDNYFKYVIKKHFIGAAAYWISSGNATTDYFVNYGASPERIYRYPFTSLWKRDLDIASLMANKDKAVIRKKLEMIEKKIVISVGRFSYERGYGKGYDVLCKVAGMLKKDVGVYIIGDEPTEEFIRIKEEEHLDNVHFEGFKRKEELAEYYAAADIFVLLTRNDVWGLVINEAMSFGLPIITTNMCGAGLSLIEDGINGFIIPPGDPVVAKDRIECLLSDEKLLVSMRNANVLKIQEYTIENMVNAHMRVFQMGKEV